MRTGSNKKKSLEILARTGEAFNFQRSYQNFALVKFEVFWLLIFGPKAVKTYNYFRLSGALLVALE